MRLRSTFVTLLGVLATSAVLAGPAFGAALTVTPKVVGAGKVADTGAPYSCSASPPSNVSSITCPSSNGYNPCTGICLIQFVLNLTATPEPGWRFWVGAGPFPAAATPIRCAGWA